MNDKVFNPKKLTKLNNPDRLLDLPPEYIWRKAGIESADVMVDIGAGTGFLTIPFAGFCDRIYACDISDVMIDWMTDNLVPNYPNIIPLKMEDNLVNLEDGVADLVVMMNLHHELYDAPAVLKECLRLLKAGGRILIVDWKKQDMAEGPPQSIRCLAEDVRYELITAGFKGATVFEDLKKHFLIVGQK
jgi:SAM-dependent methyltransferase